MMMMVRTFQLSAELVAGALLQHAHDLPTNNHLIVKQPVNILTVVGGGRLRSDDH